MGRNTNFACVWKTGGEYKIEHVLRMHQMLSHAYKKPFQFFVLTDALYPTDAPGEHIPLTKNWRGWFSKLELFQHDMGRVCYIDLDNTINQPLYWCDDLPTDNGEFWAQEDEWKGMPCGNMGSSTMIWEGSRSYVTEAFKPEIHYKQYSQSEPPFYGDQNFIQHHIGEIHFLPRYYFAAWPYDDGHRWEHAKMRFHCHQRPWDMGLPHTAINSFVAQPPYQRS